MQKLELKKKTSKARKHNFYGIAERNERRDRLTEFAKEFKLIIAIPLFQKKKYKPRFWIWESPVGETRNQVDFALSNQRGIVTNCEVITKAD